MGGLAIARVGYGTWLKFVWPLLLLLAILTIIVLDRVGVVVCIRAASGIRVPASQHRKSCSR